MPLLCLYVNCNPIFKIRKQYSASLVIAVLHIITAQRDNYNLLFKDLLLVTQAQAPLRVVICYLTADVSPGMEQLTQDKWLEIGMLGNWTAHDALNASQTLIDKVKTPYLQFSGSVLPPRKGNPLVSTPATLAIRFIIIIISKCLKQRVINNFIITRSIYYFLFSGKREDKGQQLVKTIFFSRVLQDKFYNKKNKETIVN